MLTRRTFFSGLTSLLAGLPFVGKAFAQEAEPEYITLPDLPVRQLSSQMWFHPTEVIEWIPVEERLPDASEPYEYDGLIFRDSRPVVTRDKSGRIAMMAVLDIDKKDKMAWVNLFNHTKSTIETITHWAELPKGPME